MDAGSPACMTQPYLMWNPSSAGRVMNGALIGNLDPGRGKIDCWGDQKRGRQAASVTRGDPVPFWFLSRADWENPAWFIPDNRAGLYRHRHSRCANHFQLLNIKEFLFPHVFHRNLPENNLGDLHLYRVKRGKTLALNLPRQNRLESGG